MSWRRVITARLRALLRRRAVEQDIDEELRVHVEMETEANVLRGMTPEEARGLALRGFGDVVRVKEAARDVRGGGLVETTWLDARYAARTLRKNPAFTLIAALTLALGVGANTALFTIFNALALRPLPIKDPSSVVQIYGRNARGERRPLFSYADYLDLRARNTTLSGLVAWNKVALPLGESAADDEASVLAGDTNYAPFQIVSENYFEVLGARTALGRAFLPEENGAPNSHPVVVLSDWFWRRHLDSDPGVLGKAIKLRGEDYTVVGVAEPGFIGTTPDAPAGWLPLMMRDRLLPPGSWNHGSWLTDRGADSFSLLGRLRPGVTREQARADLSLVAAQLISSYPSAGRKTSVAVEGGMSFVNITPELWPVVAPLLLAVGLVLLIACANVANLLLARGTARQKEIGVRLALGATRARLVRQLLTESLLLSSLGGAAGLTLALWTLSALYPYVMLAVPVPAGLKESFVLELGPDYRVFGFSLLASFAAGVAAGLAPAVRATRPDLIASLKEEGSALGGRLSQSRLRDALAVLQIAVSVTLLVGAGVLVRNVRKVQSLDTGLETKNVIAVAAGMSREARARRDETGARRLLAERLRALPGVAGVCQSYRQPLAGVGDSTTVTIPERETPSGQPLTANYNFVSEDYFSTLGLPVVRGRVFTRQEIESSAAVVVVSESAARRFWPGEDPLGKRISFGATSANRPREAEAQGAQVPAVPAPSYEVVGVAKDVRNGWVWQKDGPYLYAPLYPTNGLGTYLLVKSAGDPRPLTDLVRREVSAGGGDLTLSVRRVEDNVEFQLAPFRAIAALAGVLGLLALGLATVGLYGVMSFLVGQRTREIGIRVALGATPRDVVLLFLRQGARLVITGLVCGLAGGAAITRLLEGALVDLSPLDPPAFAAVSLFLAAVALAACYVPSRRATKVDPLVALRAE